MEPTSSDLAARIWDGVVMGLALAVTIAGGFAMGRIDGVQIDDDHPPSDEGVGEGGA
jgi:hypothetical protein